MGGFYNIPSTENFSSTLCHFVDQYAQDHDIAVSTIKIYVPTRRSLRTLKESFLRRSQGKPRILPIIQAIGDSDDDEMSFLTPHTPQIPPAIDSTERQIILARLLEKAWNNDEYRFSNALPIAKDLGRLLDQIHTENIPLSNLDHLVDIQEFAEHWNITLSFLKLLLNELWPTYLDAANKIDAGLHRRLKIEAIAKFYQDIPPQNPIFIAGSTGSHPATRHLIQTIASHENGFIFLPGLDLELDDASWISVTDGHPQDLLKKLLSYCKVDRKDICNYQIETPQDNRLLALSEIMRPADKTDHWQRLIDPDLQIRIQKGVDHATLCQCENEEHEARTIALAMAEIAHDPQQEKTCILITPDRNLSARVQAQLLKWDIACDDSAGASLPQTALGRFALSVLECENHKKINPVPFLSTFKSVFCGGGGVDQFRTQLRILEKNTLRGVRPDCAISDLSQMTEQQHDFIDHIADLLRPLHDLSEGVFPLNKWLMAHIQTLENIAKTDEKSGAERLWVGHEGEALALLFEKLHGYTASVPDLCHNDYILFFRSLLDGVQTRPPYGTHPRLSILGQIEARMASANRIILAGLNEGVWPPESGFDSWMSRPMRARFGLPALEQKTTLSAHDFATALGGDDVFVTFSNRKAGQPSLPSRWIQRMETMLLAAGIDQKYWPHEKGKKYQQWVQNFHTPETIKPCDRPMPTPIAQRRPTQFSITDIEKWMRDPYTIYAKKVLRLRKMNAVDENVSVADKGTLIHAAMESFTQKFSTHLPDDALDQLLILGHQSFQTIHNPEIQGLWWPRFERAAKWVISHEKTWRHHTYKIYAEQECSFSMSLNNVEYTLVGKADRIEQRTGNDWAIIDYKTGGVPSPKDVIAGVSNQLSLEAFLLEKGAFPHLDAAAANQIDLCYWSLSGAGAGGKASFAQGNKGADTQILAQEAEEGIQMLLSTFASETTPYIATPDPVIAINPDHNDYTHLERLAEWSVLDGGDGS